MVYHLTYSIVSRLYLYILITTKEQYKNNIIIEKIRLSEAICQKLYNQISYIFL